MATHIYHRFAIVLFLFYSFLVKADYVLANEPMDLVLTYPIYKNTILDADKDGITITKKEIEAIGAKSLAELLSSLASISSLQINGKSRTSFSLRGFGENATANTLILLNGKPIVNPDTSFININSFSTHDIQRVEILPASEGVLYGDQAVGGVINIITRNPEYKTMIAEAGYGSFDSKNAYAMSSNILGNGLACSISLFHNDSDNYRRHNKSQDNSIDLSMRKKWRQMQMKLHYWHNRQNLQLPGALTWKQVQLDPRQAASKIPFDDQEHDIAELDWQKYLNRSFLLEVNGAWRSMHGDGAGVLKNQVYPFIENKQNLNLRSKLSGTIIFKNRELPLVLGIDLLDSYYKFNSTRSNLDSCSGYGQLKIPLVQNLTATLGSRLASAYYDNSTQKSTAATIGLAWHPLTTWRFFLRRATSFRFPKVDENQMTLSGEPLATQTGTSYETGAILQLEKFKTSAVLYRLDLENEIISVPQPTAKYYVFNVNLDPTRRTGLIFDLSYQIRTNLRFNANLNLIDAKFTTAPYKGKDMPFVANENWNLNSTYNFSSNWELYVCAIFTGRRFPINDVENRAETIGGFTIYNLNLSFKRPHYRLSLGVENLTNKLYFGYAVATYADQSAATVYYPQSGMRVMFSAQWRF